MRWRTVVVLTLIAPGAATHAESPGWTYSTTPNPMTSQPIRSGSTHSVNVLQFHGPFAGPQHATLTIRSHPREGTDVLLSVERGQFLSSTSGCQALVRFDDASPIPFAATEPVDASSTAVFVRSVGQFLQSLRGAHRVLIEATFYQEGNRVIEFHTQGLEWDATKEERAYTSASKIAAARRATLARCTPSPASPPTLDCIEGVRACEGAYEMPGLSTSGNVATALKCINAVGH